MFQPLVGRLRKNSVPLKRTYKTKRFKYSKGECFLCFFNIRLFIYLMTQKLCPFMPIFRYIVANWMVKALRKSSLYTILTNTYRCSKLNAL